MTWLLTQEVHLCSDCKQKCSGARLACYGGLHHKHPLYLPNTSVQLSIG